MLFTLSPCHKLSHLLGPPPSVTYFMDGPEPMDSWILNEARTIFVHLVFASEKAWMSWVQIRRRREFYWGPARRAPSKYYNLQAIQVIRPVEYA